MRQGLDYRPEVSNMMVEALADEYEQGDYKNNNNRDVGGG